MLKKSMGFLWIISTFFVLESFGADGGWRGDPRGEEDFPERAAPAALALPAAPREGDRKIWKPKQIRDELERIFITDEPHADSEFFNDTIQDISAHVVLLEARFRSLFTDLSKELEGDFYTHLYGPRPSFCLEEVAKSTHMGLYALTVGGVLTVILNPEQAMFYFGLGGAFISVVMIDCFIIDAGKYCFDHVRNGMQWDYRGWCCGSTGCWRPNSKDVLKASVLSKFVSILTIALNAEALGAMTDEVALHILKRKIRTSLRKCKEFTNERSEVLAYFFRNCEYRTCLTDGDLARDD